MALASYLKIALVTGLSTFGCSLPERAQNREDIAK